MEAIVSTISRGPAAVRGTAEWHPWVSRLAATLKRRWVAYISWRLEQGAIAVFCSMSDRELRDIGLTRGDVTRAASGAFKDDNVITIGRV